MPQRIITAYSKSAYWINPDGTLGDTLVFHATASIGCLAQAPNGDVFLSTDYGSGYVAKYLVGETTADWTYTIDNVRSITADASGNVYIGTGTGSVVKLNSEGTYQWTNSDHGSTVSALAVDSSGNVYTGGYDYTVRKINSAGTQQWSNTDHGGIVTGVEVDSSGNVFSGSYDATVQKLNSSGVQQWSYTADTGDVRGLVLGSDGYIYAACYTLCRIKKIRDDGTDYTLIWSSEYDSDSGVCIRVAVDDDSNVFGGFADNSVRKFDSSGDADWTYSGLAGDPLAVLVDQVQSVQAGDIETTETIEGSGSPDHIDAGGDISTTETIEGNPASGSVYFSYDFGTESFKKIYTSPYSETIEYDLSSTYTPVEHCVDEDGNFYLGLYGGTYYTWAKFDSEGNLIWHKIIPGNTIAIGGMATDGTDLFIGCGNIVHKYEGSDGSEITTGNWPISLSDISTQEYPTSKKLQIGRDGYLYYATNSTSSGHDGYLYKFDPSDGSKEWDYKVPHLLESDLSINDIDINSDGYVAIACVAHMQLSAVGDPKVIVLDSTGTLDSSMTYGDTVSNIRIDESGYVYLRFYGSYDAAVGKYDPSDGSEEWVKEDWYAGPISDLTPDESGLYYMSTGAVNDLTRVYYIDTATGNVLTSWPDENGTPDLFIKNSKTPAWAISIIEPSNGIITNTLGVEFETKEYLFPVGEDIEFLFTPDAGYAVSEVTIDSVSQGVLSSYEFTALDMPHTIEVEFVLAVDAGGDIETTESLEGQTQQQVSVGDIETTETLEVGTVGVVVDAGGDISTTGSIEGGFQQRINAGDIETTESLEGQTQQQVVAGDIETTENIEGPTGINQTISAGDIETTESIEGEFLLIDLSNAIELYILVLTGANDSLADLEIDISSFQLRQYIDGLSYLSVSTPRFDLVDEITARSNGTLELYIAYANLDLTEIVRNRIIETAFDSVPTYEGVENQSITLSGNETTTMKNSRLARAKTLTLDRGWFNHIGTSGGLITARMTRPHLSLYAGDTVVMESGSIEVGRLSWTLSESYQQIEIAEAAA